MIRKLQDIAEWQVSSASTEPVILCAADDNYVKPLTVMLHSAARSLKPGNTINAIVLDGGISDENLAAIKESLVDLPIQTFTIKPGLQDVDSLMTSHHITHTAYLRLLAGRLLPDSVDKVIYLDSDVLVRGDLTELWEYELGNNYALAVPDIACPYVDARYADCNFKKSSPYFAAISPIANWKELGLDPDALYFNSGVMVLNVRRMREERIERKLLRCLSENARFVWCWDQYALNVVFADAWRPLPLRWNQGAHVFEFPNQNHSPFNIDEFVETKDFPSIIHFTTEWKPWDFGNKHPLKHLYFEELDRTVWRGWRPEKVELSVGRVWQSFATEFVKQWVIQYRKLFGRSSVPSATSVAMLPTADATPQNALRAKSIYQPQRLKEQLTIFTIPRAFVGSTNTIQRNAINSWRQFAEFADILLIGDDEKTRKTADELSVRHVSGVDTNEFGTPLLSSAFDLARRNSNTPYLAFCNCDIVFFDEFEYAVTQLILAEEFDRFLATGQRTNLHVRNKVDFECHEERIGLLSRAGEFGEKESIVCKDYFVFDRNSFEKIPDFAVGRGNWDNWMLHHAKKMQVPVVSLTDSVLAVHQTHDHEHAGGRMQSYATGVEARTNQKLAGGRHLISGSTSDYKLIDGKLRPSRNGFFAKEFWMDFHRFAAMLLNIVGLKKSLD